MAAYWPGRKSVKPSTCSAVSRMRRVRTDAEPPAVVAGSAGRCWVLALTDADCPTPEIDKPRAGQPGRSPAHQPGGAHPQVLALGQVGRPRGGLEVGGRGLQRRLGLQQVSPDGGDAVGAGEPGGLRAAVEGGAPRGRSGGPGGSRSRAASPAAAPCTIARATVRFSETSGLSVIRASTPYRASTCGQS